MNIEALSEYVYDDLNAEIISISQSHRGEFITLECDDRDNEYKKRRFGILCVNVQESTLTVGGVQEVRVVDEHPVLFEHNSARSQLMFSSAPDNPFEVIGRLMEAHKNFYDHWRPLSDHLHANSAVLSGGYGLIARGPRVVLEAYADAINTRLSVNIVDRSTPKNQFKALIFDRQFLVCSAVEVMEI
jgi:hypothetical protein